LILDQKVRQLRAIEIKKLDTQLAAEQKELDALTKDLKAPAVRVVLDLDLLKKEVL
jgi:hypothetical protein